MSIRRVFVANRGEIAVRVIRTCHELGLTAVLGVSVADRESMAADLADRTVVLGPASASASYLSVPTVVEAASATGCDAIHPGYGFLSENAALAQAAQQNGLVFVGPPASVIELAGDKLAAREAAAAAGLPVAPGRETDTLADARALADQVGFPLLIKAAGGGGGRGIKLAESQDDLGRLFGVAQAEAQAAFGTSRLYIERFIRAARHIEVQVAADDHGAVVHLGERDCSTQRRYQKLIEESPAPLLDDSVRSALHTSALAFARQIGYRNVGTVEFIVDVDTGSFFFLEMNCRLQVEHPVTEQVCGLDLVGLQLRVAEGKPLGFTQEEVTFDGCAIECRLVAEDPERDFAPSPGRIDTFVVPELPGLRVDTHCRPGALIPPYYDSLMAKVIAHRPDRSSAIATLAQALDTLQVSGVHTNRALLADLLRNESFTSAALTTKWLEGALAGLTEVVQ